MGSGPLVVMLACLVFGAGIGFSRWWDEQKAYDLYLDSAFLVACSAFIAFVGARASRLILGAWKHDKVQVRDTSTQTSLMESMDSGARGSASWPCPPTVYLTSHGVAWHAHAECARKRTSGKVLMKTPCSFCASPGH